MSRGVTKKNEGKIIIGNWKMNPSSLKEAEKLFKNVAKAAAFAKKTTVVVCPPNIYLQNLKKFSRKIFFGAQDAFFGEVGPQTGEVSAEMLYNSGARYVILGHSEKRAFGETNQIINKKIKASLSAALSPVVCVGEEVRDQDHSYFNLVKSDLEECLAGISKNSISKIIIAYEPVWAISSTPLHKDASAADCLEMSIFIKKILSDKFGRESSSVKIIYGGSVNEKDAGEFLKNGGVDGLLPGKASLDALKSAQIIRIAENLE